MSVLPSVIIKIAMDDSNILTTLKILIIGESGVGKSRFDCDKLWYNVVSYSVLEI